MCMGHQYNMQHNNCLIGIVFLAFCLPYSIFSPEMHLSRRHHPTTEMCWVHRLLTEAYLLCLAVCRSVLLFIIVISTTMMQVPDGAVDIKELKLDTFKIAGPNHILGVKLHILPLNVHLGDFGLIADPVGSGNQLDTFQSDQASLSSSEKFLAPFVCEDLLVICEFGHEK